MKINASKLNEVYLRGSVPLMAKDERFYLIPGADEFAISTYGRVYNLSTNRKVKISYIPHIGEVCEIKWNNGESSNVSVESLIVRVFFQDKNCKHIGQPHFSDIRKRWKIEDLHILTSQKQYVEYLLAKINHRRPQYAKSKQHHSFINRMDITRSQAAKMYQGAKGRAMSDSVKRSKPHYTETTMDDKLVKNPNEFYRWLLANQYYHPLGLELDKDIMSFGKSNKYEIGQMSLVPRYINDFFHETCSKLGYGIKLIEKKGRQLFVLRDINGKQIEYLTYDEALKIGRTIKAAKIKSIVDKERKDGYMPSYLLKKLKQWEALCKKGKIKIWEPSKETINEMRKINKG